MQNISPNLKQHNNYITAAADNKICKAVPVTGREGPYGCETSRLPHFLANRLTDGGEVVSLTRRRPAARFLSSKRFLVLISVRD
jgi:hypothetical protein